nr:MAG TPA: hypothetical protein [Bacteriophage sp.]
MSFLSSCLGYCLGNGCPLLPCQERHSGRYLLFVFHGCQHCLPDATDVLLISRDAENLDGQQRVSAPGIIAYEVAPSSSRRKVVTLYLGVIFGLLASQIVRGSHSQIPGVYGRIVGAFYFDETVFPDQPVRTSAERGQILADEESAGLDIDAHNRRIGQPCRLFVLASPFYFSGVEFPVFQTTPGSDAIGDLVEYISDGRLGQFSGPCPCSGNQLMHFGGSESMQTRFIPFRGSLFEIAGIGHRFALLVSNRLTSASTVASSTAFFVIPIFCIRSSASCSVI